MAALVAMGLGGARAAGAATGGKKVALEVEACDEAFEFELRRVLRVELGGLLDEQVTSGSETLEQLSIVCEPEVAKVSARSGPGAQGVDNDLRFDAFPGDAAPRAVALAGLEALRAVDPTLSDRIEAERARRPSTTLPPRAAAPAATTPAQPTQAPDATQAGSPSSTGVALGGVMRHFVSSPATTAWGARAEVVRRFASPWDVGADLEGTLSHRKVELGQVDATLVSAAAWVGPRLASSVWAASLSLGGRLGVAALRGGPKSPEIRGHESTHVWAGPVVMLRGDGAFGAATLALMVETGFAAASVEGLSGGVSVVGAQGLWLAVSLSPGIRF